MLFVLSVRSKGINPFFSDMSTISLVTNTTDSDNLTNENEAFCFLSLRGNPQLRLLFFV